MSPCDLYCTKCRKAPPYRHSTRLLSDVSSFGPSLSVLVTQAPQAILDRAVAEFENGRFAESAAQFDTLARAVPDRAPYLWQRGIALYYAGRYGDCRSCGNVIPLTLLEAIPKTTLCLACQHRDERAGHQALHRKSTTVRRRRQSNDPVGPARQR